MMTKIYILESIDKTKGQNGLLAYGKYLKKEIDKSISLSKYKNSPACELISIQGRYQWQKAWTKIRNECAQGIKPIIHLIVHGTFRGLKIAGYKELEWRYVLQQFKKVNNLCNKELIITMNVCYGLHCLANLLHLGKLPFDFLLASKDEVPAAIFNGTNISLNPFVAFYGTIIESSNVDRALQDFAKMLPDVNQECYSSWYLLQYDDSTPFNLCVKKIK